MKIYDVDQGSPQWAMLRAGRPTSSDFDKIITPTGRPSAQAKAYRRKLIAEIMLKEPITTFESTYWIDRGKTLEPDAAALYELTYGVETKKVGFVTDDKGQYGCSPDRFVGNNGSLEIKCPAPQTHVSYLVDGKLDKDYYPQIQGHLFVTGFDWVDIFSYHPEMPPARIRVERDEIFLSSLAEEMESFLNLMNEEIQKLIDMGHLQIEEAA